jgi:hypothetical protein
VAEATTAATPVAATAAVGAKATAVEPGSAAASPAAKTLYRPTQPRLQPWATNLPEWQETLGIYNEQRRDRSYRGLRRRAGQFACILEPDGRDGTSCVFASPDINIAANIRDR